MTSISDMVKSFQQEVTGRIGTSLMKPLLATIGNPVDETVFASGTNRAAESEVYIHLLTSEDPTSYTTALRGSFTKRDIYYGRPVLVTINDAGDYVLEKVDANRDAVYSVGIDNLDDQAPVYLRQIMEIGTLHPIEGSLQFRVTNGMFGTDYYSGGDSAVFSTGTVQDTTPANITIPTTNGQAKGVLVQLDASTGTLSYKQSSEFSAILSLAQAYKAGLLPVADDDKYRLGYLKLVKGITQFTYDHIWEAPELLSKGGGFTDFLLAADSGTPETVEDGETITVTGGTGLSSVVSATNTVTLNLDNTAVTPASYTNTNLTVDAQGRITAASNGSAGDTLPIVDSTAVVKGSSDASKQLRFEVDGFSAATTRVLTPPNYDGTIPTLAGTETFTNKTLTQFALTNATELTIASGVITVTQAFHKIDTESNAASDLLDTINGGTAGQVLILRPESTARTVVLNHAAGNITTHNGNNYVMDDSRKFALLIYDGSNWLVQGSLDYQDINALPTISTLADTDEFVISDFDTTLASAISYANLKVNLRSVFVPQPFQSGFKLRWLANDQIIVSGGAITNGTALLNNSAGVVLTLGTAGEWIDGASGEAASTWVHVYVDTAGTPRLHDTMPNNSNPSANTYVANMRVNQAGWNGTAGSGLNATSVVYDTDTGEGSITAGMLLGVYSDSAYTLGRGKGSAAAASLNNMSFALITAVNTGTNTLTLEAGHQIAINDNDYLIVIENVPVIYRYEGSTSYRWIGAMFNNASSNLDANRHHDRAYYQANEGTDYSTNSTTGASVDATNFNHNVILTESADIDVQFSGAVTNTSTNVVLLDVLMDDALIAGDSGLTGHQISSAGFRSNASFSVIEPNKLPGTHNAVLRWKTNAGVATMWNGAGTANSDFHPRFSIAIRK